MMRAFDTARRRGFTLVEAVVVIAVIGIIGAIVAMFVRLPVQGYVDSVERADLTDVADLALRKMARDIRLALPNSVRVNSDGTAIEFIPTKAGGRYLSMEDALDTSTPVLDFVTPGNTIFTVVGPLPATAGKQAVDLNNDYLVVSNFGPNFPPGDAYNLNAPPPEGINIAKLGGAQLLNMLSIASNPFAQQKPPMPSPTSRFQIVTQPVTYFCKPAADGSWTLYRKWNYGFSANQEDPPVSVASDPNPQLTQQRILANRLAANGCAFKYSTVTANARRSALVNLTLEFLPRSTGTPIRLVNQIHVDNTP